MVIRPAGLLVVGFSICIGCTHSDYDCRPIDSAIIVDGNLADSAWAKAPWSSHLIDIRGTSFPDPAYRTRFKMLWDEQRLYIAVQLEEPNVRADLTKRGSPLFHENCFELFLDPDGDGRDYWELEINARNTIWDLRMTEPYRSGGKGINAALPHARTAVRVQGTLNDASDRDEGWTIEIAIPFEDLADYVASSLPPRAGDIWRVNVARVRHILRNAGVEYSSWMPMGQVNYHQPDKFGSVLFSR